MERVRRVEFFENVSKTLPTAPESGRYVQPMCPLHAREPVVLTGMSFRVLFGAFVLTPLDVAAGVIETQWDLETELDHEAEWADPSRNAIIEAPIREEEGFEERSKSAAGLLVSIIRIYIRRKTCR
jgi:hypothetical protein